MNVRNLTCIECPIGCSVAVELQDNKVLSVTGNACPRGDLYARNEVTNPKRVVTSTVRATNGVMVPVKTDVPVPKAEIFEIMQKINAVTCVLPVKIGDVLLENISEGANLIATGNA